MRLQSSLPGSPLIYPQVWSGPTRNVSSLLLLLCLLRRPWKLGGNVGLGLIASAARLGTKVSLGAQRASACAAVPSTALLRTIDLMGKYSDDIT